MKFTSSVRATATMASLANTHDYFVTPVARQPGTAFQDACGMQAYYQMSGDFNGNIQGLEQTTIGQSDYNPAECNLWKYKGMKYADNIVNIQHYTPGQNVAMNFDIRAPNTGYANISIIDLSTPHCTIIAANLKKWDVYASDSVPTVASQENFSIKMPSNLDSKCAAKGKCAIQMHWNAPDINQTYLSCIDFTLSAAAEKRGEGRLHRRDFSPREGAVGLCGLLDGDDVGSSLG